MLYFHPYGFRKFHATLLALIEVNEIIKRFLDEKQCVIGIFADFRTACNTVNHDALIDKLKFNCIKGCANKFLWSYLTLVMVSNQIWVMRIGVHHRDQFGVFVVLYCILMTLSMHLSVIISDSDSDTQTKFIQQKYIQVPYQVYMSFLEIQITL